MKTEMGALATLNGTDDLQVALRDRADAMNISRLEIDRLAGFTGGYASKVLAPTPMKGLGINSMFSLVAALGCDLVLVENAKTTAHIKARTPPRQDRFKHAVVVHLTFSRRFMRRIGKKGGAASRANMPREQASELGRRAARARWGKAA